MPFCASRLPVPEGPFLLSFANGSTPVTPISTPMTLPIASDQVTLDTIQPSSSVGALPATTQDVSLSVPFTATDDGTGPNYVELWLRHRADATLDWGLWTMVATPEASPHTVTLPFGEGIYEFYTVAVDIAGNREESPAVADARPSTQARR